MLSTLVSHSFIFYSPVENDTLLDSPLRLSIYNDDPPSYDAVVDNIGDPACVSESTTTRDESTQSPDEQLELPPSYEECYEAVAHASSPTEQTSPTQQETEDVCCKDT